MKRILFVIFIAIQFVCLQAISMENEMTEEEMLKSYAPDLQTERECKAKELAEMKTEFAQETVKDERTKELSDSIISMKEKQIQLTDEMLNAINSNDKKKFESLSEEKDDIEQQMNMAYMKKEMIFTVADMEERAKNYSEEERAQIEEMIQEVRKSYAKLLKDEKDLYKMAQEAKQSRKDKDNILKKAEIKFLEFEKAKKEKELQ